MPAYILIIALIALPLILGTIITAAAYKAYRKRRTMGQDVERGGIAMRDLEGVGGGGEEGRNLEDIGSTAMTTTPAAAPTHPHEISIASFFTTEEIAQMGGMNVYVPDYSSFPKSAVMVRDVARAKVASTTSSRYGYKPNPKPASSTPTTNPRIGGEVATTAPDPTHPISWSAYRSPHLRFPPTPNPKAHPPPSRTYSAATKLPHMWSKGDALSTSKTPSPKPPYLPGPVHTETKREQIHTRLQDDEGVVDFASLFEVSNSDEEVEADKEARSIQILETCQKSEGMRGEELQDWGFGDVVIEEGEARGDEEGYVDVDLSDDEVSDDKVLEDIQIGSDWSEDTVCEMDAGYRREKGRVTKTSVRDVRSRDKS